MHRRTGNSTVVPGNWTNAPRHRRTRDGMRPIAGPALLIRSPRAGNCGGDKGPHTGKHVEDTVLLVLGLLAAGAVILAAAIYYETSWKARRRRRVERNHARSKLR
jgi:hypothetical protein